MCSIESALVFQLIESTSLFKAVGFKCQPAHPYIEVQLTDEQWDFFAADTLKRGDKDGNNTFDFDEFYNLFKKTLADDKVKGRRAG